MILNLRRRWLDDNCTIGDLYIDDAWTMFTLEDRVREGEKVSGATCIPEGWYETVISWSDKFGRLMPLVINVPAFSGIRIHPGNTAADTTGCILVGLTRGMDFIGQSQSAFDSLYPRLTEALKVGKVFLTISTASDVEDRRWMRI